MQTSFDPYAEWLGITDRKTSMDRYRLLGLKPFESDIAAIAHAARERLNQVRPHASGEHGEDAKKIAQEIQAAKVCLLDPQKKQAYDESLRKHLSTKTTSPKPPKKDRPEQRALADDGDGEDLLPPAADYGAPSASSGVPTASSAAEDDLLPPSAEPMLPQPTPYPQAAAAYPAAPQPVSPYPIGGSGLPQAMPVYPGGGYVPQAAPVYPSAVAVGPYAQAMPSLGMPIAAQPFLPPANAPAVQQSPIADARSVPEDLVSTSAGPSVPPRARRKKQSPALIVAIAAPIAVLAVLVGGYFVLKQQGGDQSAPEGGTPVAHAPVEVASVVEEPSLEGTLIEEDPGESPLDGGPATESPEVMPETEMPTEMPAETTPEPEPTPEPAPQPAMPADIAPKLATIRRFIALGNIAAAERQLAALEEATLDDEQAAELARLKLIEEYVKNFSDAVTQSLGRLDVGSDFAFGDDRVAFVGLEDNVLELRSGGKNQTYQVDKLPPDLAVAIAQDYLADDGAAQLSIGAYLAMHPKGDRQKAREFWTEAAQGGLQADVAVLMPELKVPLPAGLAEAEAEMPADDPAANGDGRAPLPKSAALAKALASIKAVNNDDYAKAKTPPEVLLLAEKLLVEGIDTADDPVERYALLTEARDLAIRVGDPGIVSRSADALAESHRIDALVAKAEGYAKVASTAATAEANLALANANLDLTDEAVVMERYDIAVRSARQALAAARKSKDAELLKTAVARNKEVQELREQ